MCYHYLPELQEIPAELTAAPFRQAFALAEEAALSPEDRWLYEGSLKQARTIYAQLAAAEQEGVEKGEYKKAIEVARAMLSQGFDTSLVLQLTGLSESDLTGLAV